MRLRSALLLLAIAAPLAAQDPAPEPTPTPDAAPTGVSGPAPTPAPTASPSDPVLVGAGDIADCKNLSPAAKTAVLLDSIEGTVFTLGDNAYLDGSAKDFADCYDPTWGRHKARTRPVIGNHEYLTPGAAAYFQYFGEAAGDPKKGWYSYDLGAWHIVVMNSNCGPAGGCGPDSPQAKWLREDLAAHPTLCTAAMWHHPRYSTAEHGDDPTMRTFWKILYDAGTELVLSGHDHAYERYAPQDSDSRSDPKGPRQFVIGTGGKELYPWEHHDPDLQVRNDRTFGVFKLTLHPDGYDWEFIPVKGGTFTDSGSEKCH